MWQTTRGARAWLAVVLAVAAALCCATLAQALSEANVLGLWQHPENGSCIELYRCGEGLCARVVRIEDSQKTDDKNPDPNLRQRPIIGLVILSDAHPSGPLTWSGSLYNRADGRSYEGKITLTQQDQLILTGCTAIVLCRSVTWHRVDMSK
jgi:uncharacterized protein (DUF2147 family)